MTIQMLKRDGGVTLFLNGRLDTSTAEAARTAFLNVVSEYNDIVLDFKDLAYVSSAGLRSLLTLQKEINRKGGALNLIHVKKEIMEVFEMTGFSNILSAH